ncbi:hypothetical protein HSRCO_0278 [Halanaeroarchaeum sp. HSR-CO]|uniref:hypothetical protein n=1 Tax=Halanaeroarchaeum sp. HSR-CO TaxID=2866382 RepID=UPI00217CFFB7|nr:hypothetical protein [Halanaeroarchaeum sp. HSR-CO]UWG46577.1 hypothetical protein HSRCO_0278 [Halanaeroarchaeum sp. HSR-CO]
MITSRFPPDDATSVTKPQSATLDGNQKATMTWERERSGTTFYLPMLAASKEGDTTYEVKMDGSTIFGPAAIPPTDIDDKVAIWDPPKTFDSKLTVIIRNLGTASRTYHVQPVGFETAEEVV